VPETAPPIQAPPQAETPAPDASGPAIAHAVAAGYKNWQWARDQRNDAIKQFVGRRYEAETVSADTARVAINLIAQTVITLLPHLFPQEIKHTVTTTDPRMEFDGIVVAADLDHRAREEELAETFQRAGADALLSPCGVLVTRLKAGPDRVKINGNLYDNGAFYTAYVDLDDYAIDDCAKRRGEARWEAIRWRASKEELIAAEIYDAEQIRNLPGYESDGKKASDELVKTVQCWDVYIYYGTHTRCVTIGGNFANTGDPTAGVVILADYTYEGPGQSPIRWVSFYEVPGKSAPLPPVYLWRELHDAIAKVGDKVITSILEAKVIGGYRPQAESDAKSAQGAAHMQLVKMTDPTGIVMHKFDTMSDSFYEGFDWLSRQGSDAAGGIKQKAGVQGEGDTATEASILNANSDQRITWMRSRVQKAMSQVANDRAWYIIKDPIINKLTGIRMPGGEMMTVQYSAEDREGDAVDFMFEVTPYQPESGDPNVRLKRITELLSQVLPAVFPLIQAGLIDVQGLVRLISREYGNQDFDQVIAGSPQLQMKIAAMQQMAGGMQPGQVEGAAPALPMGGMQAQGEQTSGIDAVRSAMAPGVPNQ